MFGLQCLICRRRFTTPGRFAEHATVFHHANRATVTRSLDQAHQGAAVLVETAGGKVMILIQPDLL